MPQLSHLPKHIAIIMDGNGRWAQSHGLTRLQGHRKGAERAIEIVEYCGKLNIPFLTLYAFSSENWQRPTEEVNGLMLLLYEYLTQKCDELVKNGVALGVIGDQSKLPDFVVSALKEVCRKTKNGNKLHLTLALSYGARDELVRATHAMMADVLAGRVTPREVDEALIEKYLDTRHLPDPDLFIRTSGEKRLSNFLLWQLSYSELYFTDASWPEFGARHLDDALATFAHRDRRFGLTSEQLNCV